jgi:sugar lactone lactonase YvrE
MSVSITTAEPFLTASQESDRFLPEGPRLVTVAGRSAIAWVNIQKSPEATSGSIHLRFLDNSETRVLPQSGRPGFLLPTDREDCVLVGRGKEIGLVNLRTNEWTPWATIPDLHERTIINDGEIVPGGEAIVFGTKDIQFREAIGHLYLFTSSDRQLTVLCGDQTCSNGKVFARDGTSIVLFDIDTPRRQVTKYRLNLNTRQLEFLGVAVDLASVSGFPDGMADCGDGTVIIAFYNPEKVATGKARRFRLSDGVLLEEWDLPGSPRVTCPLLFSYHGTIRVLFTTATEGMPTELREIAPEAGNLFIAPLNLTTVPPIERVKLSGETTLPPVVNPPAAPSEPALPTAKKKGNTWVLVTMSLTVTISVMMGIYMYFKYGSGEIVPTLWQKFIPPEGVCTVDFPITPKMEEAGLEGFALLKGRTYTAYRWFEKVKLSLTWVDLDPELAKKTTFEQIVLQLKGQQIEKLGSQPTRESPSKLTMSKRIFDGAEFEYHTPDGILVHRYYLEREVKYPRLFVLSVTGKNLRSDSDAVSRFFNSFRPE